MSLDWKARIRAALGTGKREEDGPSPLSEMLQAFPVAPAALAPEPEPPEPEPPAPEPPAPEPPEPAPPEPEPAREPEAAAAGTPQPDPAPAADHPPPPDPPAPPEDPPPPPLAANEDGGASDPIPPVQLPPALTPDAPPPAPANDVAMPSPMGVPFALVPLRRKTLETDACAPFVTHGRELAEVRRRLLERAHQLGHEMTDDADLRIEAAGETVRAIAVDGPIHLFRLPRLDGEFRLLSRAVRPMEVNPGTNDDRTLGVMISGMVVHDQAGHLALPPDDPAMAEGFWNVERDADGTLCRWTNGQAVIRPSRGFAGHVTIGVKVVWQMRYWL